MLIACPNCTTSYDLDASSLGRTGRSVRCVRCRQVWFATNPGVLAAVAQAYREDVGVADPASPAPPPDLPVASADPSPPSDPLVTAEPEPPVTAPAPAAEPEAAALPAELPADEAPPPPAPPTVDDAPALAPTEPGNPALPAPSVAKEPARADVETVAARRIRRQAVRRRRRWPLPGWTTAILTLVAINAGLIAYRTEVVRLAPQTASLFAAIRLPVNLRGLVFADVVTETETHEGVTVLVVAGTIASTAPRPVEVPRLRFAVRNERGHEIYTWTAQAPRNVLAPAGAVAFRSRLASPPHEGRDVLVRFHNRRDLGAGIP
jgi:predicted Zn finger-like uncharacterized protein